MQSQPKLLRVVALKSLQDSDTEEMIILNRKSRNSIGLPHRSRPVFLLTDLDSPSNCPPNLIQSWIKGSPNPGFFLRVAVMEVESWVLADRQAVAQFLSVPVSRISRQTDEVTAPKEHIVSLARGSRSRTIREALVPAPGSTAPVGNEYNPRLIEFVRESWDLARAASVSSSLKRTLDRLRQES